MATEMAIRGDAATREELLERVAREDVRLVDLQFSDIAGGARVMTIPGHLLPSVLQHGYRFDGSAVTGGQREVEMDLFLVPDPATLVTYVEPTGAGCRARFSCSVRRRDGQPFAGDPRSVLERNLAEARAAGFDYRVAIELEYYLFQPDNAGLLPPPDTAGYFGTGPGLGTGTRDDVVASLAEMGIQVGGAHHETGPGQEELDLLTADPLRMADTVLTVREVIRAVAQRHGLRANFMPKPLADAPGSGMHIFQRLYHLADGSDALRGEGETISHPGPARDRRAAGARAGHERDRLSDRQLVQAAGRGTPRAAPRHLGPAQPGIVGARALLGTGDRLHGRARAAIAGQHGESLSRACRGAGQRDGRDTPRGRTAAGLGREPGPPRRCRADPPGSADAAADARRRARWRWPRTTSCARRWATTFAISSCSSSVPNGATTAATSAHGNGNATANETTARSLTRGGMRRSQG